MCQMEVLRLLVGDCPTINHDVAPPCSGLSGEEHGWLEKVTQSKGKACIHERKEKRRRTEATWQSSSDKSTKKKTQEGQVRDGRWELSHVNKQ